MSDKRIQMMGEAPVTKTIFKLSLPVVMGMMVQVLYNLVDTFFIGQLNDPNQLAAANLTTPVFMMMMAFAGIIGTGASSYISRSLGEKNFERANKTLSTGIAIVIGLAILVTGLGLTFLSPFIKVLGASTEVYPFAFDYSFILFIGCIFVMCNFSMGQLLRSEGAIMPSIIGMMIGTITNVILDPLFIFTFKMGIKGAAIATVIGNAFGVVYYVFYYLLGKSVVKLSVKSVSLDKRIWGQIWGVGIPASVSQLLLSVAMIVSNNLAVAYGDVVVAAMGVSNKIMTIGTFVFMGFSAGCQPLVGFNYGAKNYTRVNEIIKKSMLITFGIGVLLFGVFGIFARDLICFFANDMSDVIEIGTVILRALMWTLIVLGPQMLASTTVQAFGKAGASLFLSVARQGIFYIPLLYILNSIWKFNGLIYALPIADSLTLVLSLIVLKLILSKTKISEKS